MQKLVEAARCIVTESIPILETPFPIKAERRLELFSGTSFQPHSTIATLSSLGNYVVENLQADSLAQMP